MSVVRLHRCVACRRRGARRGRLVLVGAVAPGYWTSIALGTLWFVVLPRWPESCRRGAGGCVSYCAPRRSPARRWRSAAFIGPRSRRPPSMRTSSWGSRRAASRSEGQTERAAGPVRRSRQRRTRWPRRRLAAHRRGRGRRAGRCRGRRGTPTPAPVVPVRELQGRVRTRGHSATGRAAVAAARTAAGFSRSLAAFVSTPDRRCRSTWSAVTGTTSPTTWISGS